MNHFNTEQMLLIHFITSSIPTTSFVWFWILPNIITKNLNLVKLIYCLNPTYDQKHETDFFLYLMTSKLLDFILN